MARPGAVAGVAVAVAIVGLGGYVADRIHEKQRLIAQVKVLTGGDPDRGHAALMRRPCGGCHLIPGVAGAKGNVGAPLTAFASRAYIAGRVQNTPDNLVQWIEDPHTIDPQNVMPPMGIGEREARDIAAYLYTLN